MDTDEEMELRADSAAEAALAHGLDSIYQGTSARFSDDEIDALRSTFKVGWITGYKDALVDTARELKGFGEEST